MNVREEKAVDKDAIWRVHAEAFETEAEADLVNALREIGVHCISLVAEDDSLVVGHILFSPVELVGDDSDVRLMGLAPMAVRPALQNKGYRFSAGNGGIKEVPG
ncbi:MAG: GNAT family N-acetyltransferase [Syntrophales bacterium]|nr:GNAT family N-acetyltransferase [Syntrophales bacterium]